ncbi:MAG: glutathione S-transferase N-terminal domain-containing protein [Myxococcota bacterium]
MSEKIGGLALYVSPGCFYCSRVQRVVSELGVQVEVRDTWTDPRFRQELTAAMGRGTVPVLRIEGADGQVRWLPESLDIIAWLKANFGGAS